MYSDKKQIGGFLVDEVMGKYKRKKLQKGIRKLLRVMDI